MALTASIASLSNLKNSGVTPELTQEFYDHLARTKVAIVELTSASRTEAIDSDSVKLEITMLEVAPDGDVEEFLRELSRAFYRSRDLQAQLGDDIATEPSAEDIIERIRQYFGLGAVPADA